MTTAFFREKLKKVGAYNYDNSFKVVAITTMIGQTLFCGLIPAIFTWARYPCGGTFTGFYQADTGFSSEECYWNVFDVVTPTAPKGTTHSTQAFVQNNFEVRTLTRDLITMLLLPCCHHAATHAATMLLQ